MAARPRAFRTSAELRAWLAQHHASAGELVVRCFKSHARQRGMTYPQAVDEALCFGWIDGVRHAFDEDTFTVRFTPRKAKSVWSAVNRKRAGELTGEGRMRPAGVSAFRARALADSGRYSYESRSKALDAASLRKLRANPRAWAFYQAQPPWYRRTSAFWVLSAKREETRARRLEILITSSERGTTIPLLTRNPKPPRKTRKD